MEAETAYLTIKALFDPPLTQRLEIEILPSSIYPNDTILQDGTCIGISKPLLLKAFAVARTILLSSGRDPKQDIIPTLDNFYASHVLLLFDPEYLAAANLRKRWLRDPISQAERRVNNEKLDEHRPCFINEFRFLDGLLTSPLHRHTKSPTLWGHRYWLISHFGLSELCKVPSAMAVNDIESWKKFIPLRTVRETQHSLHTSPPRNRAQDETNSSKDHPGSDHVMPSAQSAIECSAVTFASFIISELRIISLAAERHPKNYYAWNYARKLLHRLDRYLEPCWRQKAEKGLDCIGALSKFFEGAAVYVKNWCCRHPDDISGWMFLQYLLWRVTRLVSKLREHDVFQKEPNDTSAPIRASILKEIIQNTINYRWSGEAVWRFISLELSSIITDSSSDNALRTLSDQMIHFLDNQVNSPEDEHFVVGNAFDDAEKSSSSLHQLSADTLYSSRKKTQTAVRRALSEIKEKTSGARLLDDLNLAVK